MKLIIAKTNFSYNGMTIRKGDMLSENLFTKEDLTNFWLKGYITWFNMNENQDLRKVQKPKQQKPEPATTQKSLFVFIMT